MLEYFICYFFVKILGCWVVWSWYESNLYIISYTHEGVYYGIIVTVKEFTKQMECIKNMTFETFRLCCKKNQDAVKGIVKYWNLFHVSKHFF